MAKHESCCSQKLSIQSNWTKAVFQRKVVLCWSITLHPDTFTRHCLHYLTKVTCTVFFLLKRYNKQYLYLLTCTSQWPATLFFQCRSIAVNADHFLSLFFFFFMIKARPPRHRFRCPDFFPLLEILRHPPSCLYLLVVIYGVSPVKDLSHCLLLALPFFLSLLLSPSLGRFHLAKDKTS